jgi:hypothetical protein
VLTDASLARELGDGGARRAEQLSWTRVVHQYETLLSEVLAARRRRKPLGNPRWMQDLAVGPQPVDQVADPVAPGSS